MAELVCRLVVGRLVGGFVSCRVVAGRVGGLVGGRVVGGLVGGRVVGGLVGGFVGGRVVGGRVVGGRVGGLVGGRVVGGLVGGRVVGGRVGRFVGGHCGQHCPSTIISYPGQSVRQVREQRNSPSTSQTKAAVRPDAESWQVHVVQPPVSGLKWDS